MLYAALLVSLLSAASPGPWGHEPYPTASPLDVAVAPADGRIYVADTAAGQIVVLNPDFTPTGRTLAVPGVVGLDVAPDGRIAAVRDGSAGVLLFAPDQPTPTELTLPALERSAPAGVCWGPGGILLVFDRDAGRVRVLDPDGRHAFDFGEYTWQRSYHSRKADKRVEEEVRDQLRAPVRGAFLPDGRLIVADAEGPVIDPELDRCAGHYSVWRLALAGKQAQFERFLPQPDYYPSSRAGDVAVDAQTGRIYTAEADFPLTDHNVIRVYDRPDEQPRYTTNNFPIRFLTHPRGLAVGAEGRVIVAEADKGLVFALASRPFDTPRGERDPLEWPKLLRIPVCERERVVLEYTTLEPAPSRVEYALVDDEWYDYPAPPDEKTRQVVETPALNERWQPLEDGKPGTNHRVELTGLSPGRRYSFRYLVSERAYPGPLWSETFLATTQPPAGQTQYLDAEVIVLLFSNLKDPSRDPNVRPQPAEPGPMSEAEIAAVRERLEWARRFYWINARGKFNVRYKFIVHDEKYDGAPVANYGYWPHDDHRKIDEILAAHGVAHADTAGLVVLYGYRHWDDGAKKWVLSGSGGNTWGSIHDGSAINTFSCGGDTAWLFVHEYGHSMSINYQYSGHNFHFNHFHWNYLPTDYGSHYDGMAAMCREFSDVAYWSNKYGRLRVVADGDGDGLPDADPQCYLDEQRFGSDPARRDTDGDGLTDLEELLTTQGMANYELAFNMRQVKPLFEPGPTTPDTDGDGVPDGADLYPLYPWDVNVHEAPIQVDGRVVEGEWPAQGFRRVMTDPDLTGDVRLAWDAQHLYVGVVQKKTAGNNRPARLYLELDANDDGMTVGSDNIEFRFEPLEHGEVRIETKHNDTVFRTKPIWRDNILPSPRDMQARWSVVNDEFQLEIAISQTKDAGLDLVRNERLGFLLQLKPEAAKQELRLFEPQTLFDVRLR